MSRTKQSIALPVLEAVVLALLPSLLPLVGEGGADKVRAG